MNTRPLTAASAQLVLLGLLFLPACKAEEEQPPGTCVAEPRVCDDLDLVVPPPTGEAVGVWDGERRRFVVFGGDVGTPIDCIPQADFEGSTWAFLTECDAWVSVAAAEAPPPRGRHVAALDADGGRMIIHGGRFRETGSSADYDYLDDTWALDLATDTWTRISDGDGPQARVNHVGAVAGGRFVVHGGDTDPAPLGYTPQADVWVLDLAAGTWEELDAPGGPSARLFHAGAASPDGGTLYVYGGTGADPFFSPAFGDLWALDLETGQWQELHDGTGEAPDSPFWANLLADPQAPRLLLWAGHDDTDLGNTNQLWAFDLSSGQWELLRQGDEYANPANAFCDLPADFADIDIDSPERRNAGAAAITSCGELVVFGGKTDCGIINDLWAWKPDSGWQERSAATAGQVCQRAFAECEALCF